MWNVLAGFDTLITDYYYNSQDQITFYSHSGKGEAKTFRNTYDYAGRLLKVDYYTGAPEAPDPFYLNLAEYQYNENSQVSQQLLNDGVIKNNFGYTNRNWIEYMLNSGEMFGYTNTYFKNGNVKSQELAGSYNDNFAKTDELTFYYSYDKSNRLLIATKSGSLSFQVENAYDSAGNITMLKRYNGDGSIIDNFAYSYNSGTNKLRKVTGSTDQYTYDNNGNMTRDDLNKNSGIKYDHRNLITELRHKTFETDTVIYFTFYSYDESGNRFAKTVYKTDIDLNPPDSISQDDMISSGEWELYNQEFYSRDVSGRELAIYKNDELEEYPLYGLDLIGKLKNDLVYFYHKDHLGSVRAVVNAENELVSSQDYDPWGYILQDRTFDSDSSKFKFTSKERDVESKYDYFGARYYDARIGRWGQVDPELKANVSLSSYQYAKLNPLYFFDPDGKIEIPKEYKEQYPHLYSLIEEKIQNVTKDEEIMDAMIETTKISRELIEWGLNPENPPALVVMELGLRDGQELLGHYDSKNKTIQLDIGLVNELEKSRGDDLTVYTFLIQSIILHEGAHAAKNITGIPKGKEPGNEWEKSAFGGVISSYNAAVIVLNNRNILSGNPKRYKEKEGGW